MTPPTSARPFWQDITSLGAAFISLVLAGASVWACRDGGVRPWLPWLYRSGVAASGAAVALGVWGYLRRRTASRRSAGDRLSPRPAECPRPAWPYRVGGLLGCVCGGFFLLMLPQVVHGTLVSERMTVANNLHQIGVAFHEYATAHHDRLPPAASVNDHGERLLSWRVLVLPYLGCQDLYAQFRLDEPWDSPHNLTLLPQMPNVYASPQIFPVAPHHTRYQAFVGPGTAFDGGEVSLSGGFADGTSSTLVVAEAAAAVPWTKPQDLAYDPNGPLPAFRETGDGWTAPGVFFVLFADAAVRACRWDSLREEDMRASITRNGGERGGIER